MQALVWIGAALTLVGFIGILWSVILVRRARKDAADDDALRVALQKIVPINVGALMTSMLGLALVLVGVILS